MHFLTQIVQVMASRAQVTLNARRLYAADGRAVKELLKIARLLYKAQNSHKPAKEGKGGDDDDEEDESFAQACRTSAPFVRHVVRSGWSCWSPSCLVLPTDAATNRPALRPAGLPPAVRPPCKGASGPLTDASVRSARPHRASRCPFHCRAQT